VSAQDGFSLLLEFDNDEPAFRRGFELGNTWGRLKASDEEYGTTVHADCAEMILRIAESLGREVSSRDLNDDWIEVTFSEPGRV
jgi:hypothetical protein